MGKKTKQSQNPMSKLSGKQGLKAQQALNGANYQTYITTDGNWGGYPEAEAIARTQGFTVQLFALSNDEPPIVRLMDTIGNGAARNFNLLLDNEEEHYVVVNDTAIDGVQYNEATMVQHNPAKNGNCLFEALAYIDVSNTPAQLAQFNTNRDQLITNMRQTASDNIDQDTLLILEQELLWEQQQSKPFKPKQKGDKLSKENLNAVAELFTKYPLLDYYAEAQSKPGTLKFMSRTTGKPVPNQTKFNVDVGNYILACLSYQKVKAKEKKEKSDIKKEYDVTNACVLQSLITAGQTPFNCKTAKELHNKLWNEKQYQDYKLYDLDDIYPLLYQALDLTKHEVKGETLQNLVDRLEPGSYIVELPGTSDEGHNSVLEITIEKKQRIGKLKDALGNKSRYKLRDNVNAYWD